MNLFTYGTLMDAEIWSGIARETCAQVAAVLPGYEARRLRGVDFPGLIECEGAETRGLLYTGVGSAALTRLDEYEGDYYERIPVTVLTGDNKLQAEVYVMRREFIGEVLPEKWTPPGQ